mgnify:CR=1 FL=1
MISLHVYLTPEPGKIAELEDAVVNRWMKAMVEQPGFISAAMLKPFDEQHLAKLEAAVPEHYLEVVAFWKSEEERLAWVARPIHDKVFEYVLSVTSQISHTLKTGEQSWNI